MDNKEMLAYLLKESSPLDTPTPSQLKAWLAQLLLNDAIKTEICFDRRAYQLTVYVRLDVDELKK